MMNQMQLQQQQEEQPAEEVVINEASPEQEAESHDPQYENRQS
jgi:hypothetical protein